MTPQFITFTGVDNQVDLSKLIELSNLYPIEWGVLIGGNPLKNRYPKLDRINEISEIALNNNLNCALHLCGEFARAAKDGIISSEINISGYKRFQINSIYYDFDQLGQFARSVNKDIIFQHRTNTFPTGLPPRVYPLHDKSGGKGKVPTSRPVTPDTFVGFAGGIGPTNVMDILSQISPGKFWIDMESSLRIDDKFDLNICEQICRKVWNENL